MKWSASRLGWVGALLGAGCSLLSLEGYEGGRPPGPDASAPDADAASEPDARACALHRWPDRPLQDDGNDDGEYVLALYTFGLGDESDGGLASLGYDLDGVCTCPEPPSCKLPASATACDGPGGVDNAGSGLLAGLAKLTASGSDIDRGLQTGQYGLVLRLRHYNGTANDREVEVSAFAAAIAKDDAGVDAGLRWDGTDEISVDPDSVFGTSPPYQAVFTDTRAYVANGVMVSHLDVPIRLGRLLIDVRGSAFTATIRRDGATLALDEGLLVGRATTRTILTTLAQFDDPLDKNQYLCGDSGSYAVIKTQVCSIADITADPSQDNRGAPCDAISIAARFTMRSARLGVIGNKRPPRDPCGPGWTDDCSR